MTHQHRWLACFLRVPSLTQCIDILALTPKLKVLSTWENGWMGGARSWGKYIIFYFIFLFFQERSPDNEKAVKWLPSPFLHSFFLLFHVSEKVCYSVD